MHHSSHFYFFLGMVLAHFSSKTVLWEVCIYEPVGKSVAWDWIWEMWTKPNMAVFQPVTVLYFKTKWFYSSYAINICNVYMYNLCNSSGIWSRATWNKKLALTLKLKEIILSKTKKKASALNFESQQTHSEERTHIFMAQCITVSMF